MRSLATFITLCLIFSRGVIGFTVPTPLSNTQRQPLASSPQYHPPIGRDLNSLFSTNIPQQIQDADHNDISSPNNNNNKISKPKERNNLQENQGNNKPLHMLQQNKRKLALSALALAACALGYSRRQDLLPLLPKLDLSGVNQRLRKFLNKLDQAGNVGLALYASLFTLWTMTVGVTTPVETAAGFAFGAKRAILANAIGKTTGALVAFFLGRFICYEWVRKHAERNEILQLVEESITEHPLLVALMVRLSPLPEPVKNMGMSVLDIKTRYFALSVLLHGLPFTCLWSCMGAETAKVVTLGVQPSTTLKLLVSGSTWFGVILSPSLIGWWLNSLRKKRAQRQTEAGSTTATSGDSGVAM